MTESRCKYAGSDKPRTLPGRHNEDCATDQCAGCLPCPMMHCRCCGIEHAEQTCAGCVGDVREDLAELVRMWASLPDELEVKGVEHEALSLLGPTADPEARGHLRASVAAGRLSPDAEGYVPRDKHGNELADVTPLWTLGTWSMVYRDAFGHDEPTDLATVRTEAGYLDRHLTEAAAEPWVPFEQFAKEVRASVAHLERVLHDGEQVDRTRVTCTIEHCPRRPQLQRKFGTDEADDRWQCPACRTVYSPGEYRDAHARQLVHKGAEKFLPLREAVSTLIAQGRSERTIRKWMEPQTSDPEAIVGGFCEIGSHRVWVWWPDLWRLHMTTRTRQRAAA